MMVKKEFFPPRPKTNPSIYAYQLVGVHSHTGWIKIGFTDRDAKTRVAEQLRTSGVKYEIVFEGTAMRKDGSSFTDHDVHRHLRKQGYRNPEGEWFECSVADLRRVMWEIKNGRFTEESRVLNFEMRPEQAEAVEKTARYFKSYKKENPGKTPHFLWNAKMRFGKTFAAYQLARKLGWKKVLVLTFKPAVQSAWEEDLKTHVDFEGWQFISRDITAFDLNWDQLMPHSGTFINLGRGEYLLFNNTRYLNNGFRESEGFPFPIKLRISCNEPELAGDHKTVRELIDQVYQFSRMYWKSVSQQNLPVTIKYPEIVAGMFPHFEGNEIPDFGKDRLWFL